MKKLTTVATNGIEKLGRLALPLAVFEEWDYNSRGRPKQNT
jgi:hypothetical protein